MDNKDILLSKDKLIKELENKRRKEIVDFYNDFTMSQSIYTRKTLQNIIDWIKDLNETFNDK